MAGYAFESSAFELKVARSQNPNRILITQLNINSLGNKPNTLKETKTQIKLIFCEFLKRS